MEANNTGKTFKEKLAIERKLLPLNSVILFFYAGIHSFIYYMHLHMKALGLNIAEIAIISACSTIISIIAPIISGILVDKFGKYKLTISCFAIICGSLFNLLSAVPVRNVPIDGVLINETSIFLINSTNTVDYSLRFRLHENCTDKECNQVHNSIMKGDECQFADVFKKFMHNVSFHSAPIPTELSFKSEECTPSINEIVFSKLEAYNKIDCFYQNEDLIILENFCSFINECNRKGIEWNCVEQKLNSSETEIMAKASIIFDITFISVFIIEVLAKSFIFPLFPLVDAIIWATFRKLGHGKYGRSFMWITIARTIFPFLSGIILDIALSRYGPTHFWPIYALAIGLFLVGITIMLKVNLTEEKIQGNVLTNLRKIMKLKHLVFYIIVFIYGFTPGIVAIFVPIFLRTELNSPMVIIGLLPTAFSIPAIFLLFFSDAIIKKAGHFNVIGFGFFALGIRLILYSILWSPWWAIPIEVLKSFSHYLSIVAFFSYGKLITAPGLITTMSAFIRILIYGCGRSTGLALGGIMIENWHMRKTFQVLAVGLMVMSVTCIGIQCFYKKFEKLISKRNDGTVTAEELPEVKNENNSLGL